MKLLKNIIRNILIEVRTKEKTKYGQGMEHTIYPSKNHPNILFKVGEREK